MRNLRLTDRLISGLLGAQLRVLSPVATPQERSAIVTFTTGDNAADQALFERLERARIKLPLLNGSVRVSPNFFNTETEIDLLLCALWRFTRYGNDKGRCSRMASIENRPVTVSRSTLAVSF